MNTILLLGSSNDPHIQSISYNLNKISQNHVIIDRFTLPDTFTVNFDEGLLKGEINVHGKQYFIDKIKSIWNYSPIKVVTSNRLERNMKTFIHDEWIEGLSSLWNSISTRWVNNPIAIRNASNRLGQLRLASDIGLRTPKTLITNDKNKFLEFFKDCKSALVAKTLHGSEGLPKNSMIFTTKLTRNDIEHANKLVYSPCMFQEYVPKKTELRVTIIGNTLRAAEIHSQRSKKTMHDWRRYDDFTKTPYRKTSLPNDIANKLKSLMRVLNLEFGAVDLIKTPNDEIFFLEINPTGRWLWVEHLTSMSISKDIAYYLAGK